MKKGRVEEEKEFEVCARIRRDIARKMLHAHVTRLIRAMVPELPDKTNMYFEHTSYRWSIDCSELGITCSNSLRICNFCLVELHSVPCKVTVSADGKINVDNQFQSVDQLRLALTYIEKHLALWQKLACKSNKIVLAVANALGKGAAYWADMYNYLWVMWHLRGVFIRDIRQLLWIYVSNNINSL
jgi:hypothetical protein